jgi:hypothetical protein
MRRLFSLLVASTSVGCQALADPQIEYVECFPNAGDYDVETFDPPPGAGSCWKAEHMRRPTDNLATAGDLVVQPPTTTGAAWGMEQPVPFFFKTVSGDFLLVTRAEMTSGIFKGDHCLHEGEAAGIALRRREPPAWTTLLVLPHLVDAAGLPVDPMDPKYCADDPELVPAAATRIDGRGFDGLPSVPERSAPHGADGEAIIALCRQNGRLYYLMQKVIEGEPPTHDLGDPITDLEVSGLELDVGSGPVDVGVTVTAAPGTTTQPEGHFNWLLLGDYPHGLPTDGCPGTLESFSYPEDDDPT